MLRISGFQENLRCCCHKEQQEVLQEVGCGGCNGGTGGGEGTSVTGVSVTHGDHVTTLE